MTTTPPPNLQDFEDLPDPRTKAELLERMAITYNAAESFITTHDEAALTQPLEDSGWSAKDYLAHLTAWERGMVALLQKKDRFREMGIDEEKTDLDDHDAVNDALYNLHKDRPFTDILTAFRQTHQELLSVLENLNDEDLHKPYAHYQPQAQGQSINSPVMGWLAGNTYGHYGEHIGHIGRLK